MSKLHVVIFLAFIAIANCNLRDMQFESCIYPLGSEAKSNCEVHSVRAFPCEDIGQTTLCPGGSSSLSLSFEYITNFDSEFVHSNIYMVTREGEKPLLENDDGCASTICPIESGVRRNGTFTWRINRIDHPTRGLIKGKLWNDEHDECCFKVWLNFVL